MGFPSRSDDMHLSLDRIYCVVPEFTIPPDGLHRAKDDAPKPQRNFDYMYE